MLRDTSPSRDRRSKKTFLPKPPLCGKGPGTEKQGYWGVLGLGSSGVSSFFLFLLCFFARGPGAEKHRKQKTEEKHESRGKSLWFCVVRAFSEKGGLAKGPFFDRRPREGREGEISLSTPAGPLGAIFRGPSLLRLLKLLGF